MHAGMQELETIPTGRRSSRRPLLEWVDSLLERHPRLWLMSLLVAGFLVRIWHASGTYLHPDEALHFFIANKTSWAEMYRASRSLSHPPLLIFLLYLWKSLGTSELVLRIPSIIAGTAFCWLTFKWLGKVFPQSVAWTGFVFVLFLPSSIDLSTEIRQYALLLAFCMGSAYLLELAFEKDSAACMLGSGICLWLAICSHYSSFLFASVLGLYAIARLVRRQPALRVIAAWEAGQVIAFGLAYFFYVTHIVTLGQSYGGGDATDGWMAGSYLAKAYYAPGEINPLVFVLARTGSVFQYLFGQAVIGDLAFLLFIAGVVLALRKPSVLTRFQCSVLLLLPFALNCAAALLRLYPYGGTRHSAFLIPFALAGVSVAASRLLKSSLALATVAALLVALACNLFPSHRENIAKNHRLSDMTAALKFIHEQVPASGPIFADYQTSLMLNYYLCEHRPVAMNRSVSGFLMYECGGRRVIATDWNTDIFTAVSFGRVWPQMLSRFQLPRDSPVRVTQMGPPASLSSELVRVGTSISGHAFGRYIHIFDLKAGTALPARDQLAR